MSQSQAYAKAQSIQSIIGSLGEVPASGLVHVPVERDQVPHAIRKLQVQIFELSDALAATVKELEALKVRLG
jgi:hypothetical protein